MDVPTVFSQVDDEAVSSGEFDEDSCGQRIGVGFPSRLPQRRNVINVDAQPGHASPIRSVVYQEEWDNDVR